MAWSGHFWNLKSPKFAPRLRARAKSLKTDGVGALLEIEAAKICTLPARESDLEVKTVKAPGSRSILGGSRCFSRGRRRDFDTLQNAWRRSSWGLQKMAGVVDCKRVRNDACRVASAVLSCSVMSMFEASDAESVEGLQISCHGSVA